MVLRKLLSNEKQEITLSTKYIDPFGDGKAQIRMATYMQNTFDNLQFGKNEALKLADIEYKEHWGDDKVFYTER